MVVPLATPNDRSSVPGSLNLTDYNYCADLAQLPWAFVANLAGQIEKCRLLIVSSAASLS